MRWHDVVKRFWVLSHNLFENLAVNLMRYMVIFRHHGTIAAEGHMTLVQLGEMAKKRNG